MVSYRCSFCGQLSVSKQDLKNHMMLHLANRKFECSLCGKRFLNEKTLELHISIHAAEVKYGAYSMPSEQGKVLSGDGRESAIDTQVTSIPQVKVRVKTFPEKAVAMNEPVIQPQTFQLSRDDFTIVGESGDYVTSQEEIGFVEKKPVQLRMWSKEHTSRSTMDASTSKSPYVIRVIDKDPESERILEPDAFRAGESQGEQPIRIFVGSNIRLENLEDLNNLASLGEEFQTDGLPQVGFGQDQTYSYSYGEQSQNVHHPMQEIQGEDLQTHPMQEIQGEDLPTHPMQEIQGEDLPSLQEVIEEGDLESLREEIDARNMEVLEETINNGTYQTLKKELSCGNTKSFQGDDVGYKGSFLTESVPNGGNAQINQEPVNLHMVQGFDGESLVSESGNKEELQTEGSMNTKSLQKIVPSEQHKFDDSELNFMKKEQEQLMLNMEEEMVDDPMALCEVKVKEESVKVSQPSYVNDSVRVKQDVRTLAMQKNSNESMPSTPTSFTESDALVICPGKTKASVDLDRNEKVMKKQTLHPDERPFKCIICGAGFRYSFYLNAHMRSSHQMLDSTGVCCKFYKKFKKMQISEEQDTAKVFQCSECLEELRSAFDLKKHLDKHKQMGYHECLLCFLKFKDCRRLHSHLKSHMAFKCYICDKLFKENTKLNRHVDSHLVKSVFECRICKRTMYCHPREFRKHKVLHQYVMSCPYCYNNFPSENFSKHKEKCRRIISEFSTREESLSGEPSAEEDGEKENGNSTKVRAKVVDLLIEELLHEMVEADDMGDETLESLSVERFLSCVSECHTKDDLLRELSSYACKDLIRDAASDIFLKEKMGINRLMQLVDSVGKRLTSASRKRKRNDIEYVTLF